MRVIKSLLRIWFVGCLSLLLPSFTVAQEAPPKLVYQLAISGDQRVLAAIYGSYEHRSIIDFFDSSSGQLLHSLDLSPLTVGRIALSPSGDRLFFADRSRSTLAIADTQKNITVILLEFGAVSTDDIGWNPVNDEIAFVLDAGVKIWDAATGKWIYGIGAGGGIVRDFAWTWDGERLATSSYAEAVFDTEAERTVKIWDLSTIDESLTVPNLTIQDHGGGSVAWSPDGKRLAMIEEQRLLIYDVELEQIEADLPVDSEYFSQVTWNRIGNLLATGGSVIRVWDTASWEVLHTFPTDGAASTLQWSFDGQHIFSDGGSDGLQRDDLPASLF